MVLRPAFLIPVQIWPTQDFLGPTSKHSYVILLSPLQPAWFLPIDFLFPTLQCSTDQQLRTYTLQSESCGADLICCSPKTLTNIFWISSGQKIRIVLITTTILKSWYLLSTYIATHCANLSGRMLSISTLTLWGGTILILMSHYVRG